MKMSIERPNPLGREILGLILISLLPLLMTACGSSIGKIHIEDVNATINEAESAIQQARQVNAEQYASNNLNKAESILSKSRQALSEEKGIEALRCAYEARSEAKIAETQALQIKLREVEVNAIEKQKKADLEETRSELIVAKNEAEQSQSRVLELESDIRRIKMEMQKQVDKVNSAKQEAEMEYQEANSKLVAIQDKLQTLQAEIRNARDDKRKAESRANELYQQVQQLKITIREAEKKAEYAKSREKAKSQAYSKKIDKIAHEKKLREAKHKAQEYVEQVSHRPKLSGKTSLSKSEIEEARQTVAAWYRAWSIGDLSSHLEHYKTDAETKKKMIESGKPIIRKTLTRAELSSALRKGTQKTWKKTDSKVIPEKDNLIALYRFSRLSDRSTPNFYDVWTREAWFRQVGTEWKIHTEYWSFYKDVPKYPTK